MSIDLQDKLLEAILEADVTLANQLVEEWTLLNGYERFVHEILEPVLFKIGQIWMGTSDFSIAQGYVAGKIAEDILNRAAEEQVLSCKKPEYKGAIVIGNIEDDYHSLGRKILGTFLRTFGWEVYDLGNDVHPDVFIDKACETGARIIGVSAMMYTTAMNIRKVREEIDRRKLTDTLQLAVGGAVFIMRPELLTEVGGDGTAKSAFEAPALMDELLKKSLERKKYE